MKWGKKMFAVHLMALQKPANLKKKNQCVILMSLYQGNLKKESVVAAKLLYLTEFFIVTPRLPSNFVKHELPFLRGHKSRTHIGYRAET